MKHLLILILGLLFILPAMGQEDDEEMLRELEKAKAQQAESFQQIHEGTEVIKNAPMQMLEEMKKTGNNAFDLKALSDPKMVKLMKDAWAQSHLQNLPLHEVKAMIMANVKGKPAEKLFLNFPKTLDIAAGVVVDKEAMPALMGILPRQEDLKFFGFCAIGLFIFGLILKRFIVSKEASFFKRVFLGLTIQVLVTLTSAYVFYQMFHKEVGPTLRIVAHNL